MYQEPEGQWGQPALGITKPKLGYYHHLNATHKYCYKWNANLTSAAIVTIHLQSVKTSYPNKQTNKITSHSSQILENEINFLTFKSHIYMHKGKK